MSDERERNGINGSGIHEIEKGSMIVELAVKEREGTGLTEWRRGIGGVERDWESGEKGEE